MGNMENADITICYLGDYPEWVAVIAGWFYEQWYDLYAARSMTVKDLENRIACECNNDNIPLILVAIKNGEAVGTIGLRQCDMSIRKELSPWLAGLYVKPEHRCSGIGALLVEALIGKARDLEASKLYLYTPDREKYYRNLGWCTLEQTEYFGRQMTIMSKPV